MKKPVEDGKAITSVLVRWGEEIFPDTVLARDAEVTLPDGRVLRGPDHPDEEAVEEHTGPKCPKCGSCLDCVDEMKPEQQACSHRGNVSSIGTLSLLASPLCKAREWTGWRSFDLLRPREDGTTQ